MNVLLIKLMLETKLLSVYVEKQFLKLESDGKMRDNQQLKRSRKDQWDGKMKKHIGF